MKLITTCFKHEMAERNLEFKHCIVKNIDNTSIDKIVIFFEGYSELLSKSVEFDYMQNSKVVVIAVDFFPNFSVLFDYANDNFKHEIVMIANADIYFDETLAKVNKVRFKDNMMLFLTRYMFDYGDVRLQNKGSFDSYIFKSPIKPFYGDIRQGVYGCDSYLLQKAIEAEIKVFNPALSIKSYHHHFNGGHHVSRDKFAYWNQPYYKWSQLDYCTIESIEGHQL